LIEQSVFSGFSKESLDLEVADFVAFGNGSVLRGRVSRGPDRNGQDGHPSGLHTPVQEGLAGSTGGVFPAMSGVEVGLQELPVDGGQDPALHEYVAQVGGRPPVR
jgi:hypothetical protein